MADNQLQYGIYIYTVSISRICWCAKIKYEDMNRMIALRMVISLPLSLFLSLSIPPYRYSNPHKKSKSENQWCKSARKHILSIYIWQSQPMCLKRVQLAAEWRWPVSELKEGLIFNWAGCRAPITVPSSTPGVPHCDNNFPWGALGIDLPLLTGAGEGTEERTRGG